MRPSVRAAGITFGAVLSAITLAASGLASPGVAGPAGATWSAPAGSAAGQGADVMSIGTAIPADPSGRQSLQVPVGTKPSAPIIVRDRSGRLLSVTAQPDTTLTAPDGADGPDGFVRHYAPAFGLTSDYELQRVDTRRLPGGEGVIRYQQQADGVPVLGGELLVTTDAHGGVLSTIGEISPARPTATAAKVGARTAAATALADVAAKAGVAAETLTVSASDLWLYDPRLIGAPGRAEARPTWWVKVSAKDGGADVASVLVDALDGSVSLAISERQESRNRIVCDLANRRVDLNNRNQYACNVYSQLGQQSTTRREGGAASSVAEVNKAYDYVGATYDFYRSRFGRDSYDGRGAPIGATVRACHAFVGYPCPFPNAFWDGKQLVFGQGFVTDDVVAHEFTHAVIDHASNLFYAYEPGAINEAISDIMAEFVDRSYAVPGGEDSRPWLAGEDLPGGAIRNMKDPNASWQPATVGGPYWSKLPPNDPNFDNGGVHTNSGPANRLAYLIAEGGTHVGTPFAGIGLPKSEQLWYRTAHLLPSGADYNMLGAALYSTCLQMVGHHGFVRDDCRSVQLAVLAIGASTTDSDTACGGGSSEDPPVFADDMEGRDRWTFSGSIWQYVPNPEIPVRWATSGETALYGYGDGSVGYATMKDAVTIPTNPVPTWGGPYLSFQANNPAAGGLATYMPTVQYNAGAGWQNLYGGLRDGFFGYGPVHVSLEALQGKSVRFRFALTGNNTGQEWLIDDVKIVVCRYVGSPPRFVTATRNGTTAEVTWVYDSYPNDHIELTYDPPIPGAPTRLDGLGVSQSEVTRSITLTGLDPDTSYRVSIVIVNDNSNTRSRPATVTIATGLPAVCPTQPPLSATLSWTPRKGSGPVDECGDPQVAPRRP